MTLAKFPTFVARLLKDTIDVCCETFLLVDFWVLRSSFWHVFEPLWGKRMLTRRKKVRRTKGSCHSSWQAQVMCSAAKLQRLCVKSSAVAHGDPSGWLWSDLENAIVLPHEQVHHPGFLSPASIRSVWSQNVLDTLSSCMLALCRRRWHISRHLKELFCNTTPSNWWSVLQSRHCSPLLGHFSLFGVRNEDCVYRLHSRNCTALFF